MTNTTALKALLAKVEAGDVLAGDIAVVLNLHPTTAASLKGGSLDAAKALHDAVLKNAAWWVEARPDGRNQGGVTLGDLGRTVQADADTPARAWLIAILKALIAEGESQ